MPIAPDQCWAEIRDLLLKAALEHLEHLEHFPPETAEGNTALNGESTTWRGNVSEDLADPGTSAATTYTLKEKSPQRQDEAVSPPVQAFAITRPGDSTAGGDSDVPRSNGGLSASSRDDSGPEAEYQECGGDVGGVGGEVRSGLERYVDQCAWRVLHAASRTASGGDSFFVVHVCTFSYPSVYVVRVRYLCLL